MGITLTRYPRRSLAIAALFSFAACQCIDAQPLVYNTNQVVQGGTFSSVSSGNWVAARFVTGPSAATLNSVTLYETTVGNPSGFFHMSVYSDNAGAPGSVLPGGVLNGLSSPHVVGYLTYTAGAPLTLALNTPYWVVASSDSAPSFNTYGWLFAPATNFTSSAGWSLPNAYDFSPNQASSWVPSDPSRVNTLLLAIDGALVPEPSTLTLAWLAFATALWAKKRRLMPH